MNVPPVEGDCNIHCSPHISTSLQGGQERVAQWNLKSGSKSMLLN